MSLFDECEPSSSWVSVNDKQSDNTSNLQQDIKTTEAGSAQQRTKDADIKTRGEMTPRTAAARRTFHFSVPPELTMDLDRDRGADPLDRDENFGPSLFDVHDAPLDDRDHDHDARLRIDALRSSGEDLSLSPLSPSDSELSPFSTNPPPSQHPYRKMVLSSLAGLAVGVLIGYYISRRRDRSRLEKIAEQIGQVVGALEHDSATLLRPLHIDLSAFPWRLANHSHDLELLRTSAEALRQLISGFPFSLIA